jgi:pimeloyl-ACP methyl ester carboxylesterase
MELGFEDGFLEVEGARVHYIHGGSGRPLLLIHGLTGSTSNWRRNIDALARDASVYAIDLVNMGRSERVPGLDAGLAATVDRVAACMDALGLAEAEIAGHSHGGAVALMLAARHPERVRGLILFAPANPYSDAGDKLIRFYGSLAGRALARLAPYVPRWIQLVALGRMYGDPARIVDGSLEGYTLGGRVPGTIDHVLAIVRGWYADMYALKAALPLIAGVPTLLVWGDRDRAVSLASGVKLHGELPQSELVVVSGAGHVPFEEMPEAVDCIMHEWLIRRQASAALAPHVAAAEPSRYLPHTVPVAARASLSPTLQRLSTGA